MKFIDAHTHWYSANVSQNPESWAQKNSEFYWAGLVGKRADLKPSLQAFPSIDKFLRDMDEAQIERSVILGWYWQNIKNSYAQNIEIIKQVEKHSDRLSAFASLNPNSQTFEKDLKDACNMGFLGVGELHDKIQNFDFSSTKFDDFCELCSQLNFPINIHLSDPRGKDYPNKVLTSNDTAYAAAKRNTSTKFIFSHFGGGDVFQENFELPENVFYDCAANTFLYKEQAIKSLTPKLASKMIFGSDYPLRLYPKKFADCEMSEFKNSTLSSINPDFSAAFFYKNFEALFCVR